MTYNRIIASERFYPSNVTPAQGQTGVYKWAKRLNVSIINTFYTFYTDLKMTRQVLYEMSFYAFLLFVFLFLFH
jgi:hypothetical protein